MANNDIINKAEIQCLFERKPRPIEHCSRPRTKQIVYNPSYETDFPQSSYHSIKKCDQTTTNCTEKYTKDNSIYIYVHKKKRNKNRKRREYNIYQYSKNEIIYLINSKKRSKFPKHYSLLELPSSCKSKYLKQVQSSNSMRTNTNEPYNRNYIVNNCCRSCDKPECNNPFANPSVIAKIYRCQTAAEDTCCCSCNSDAMFEVMKSLYDCYKKKNCENCNCILCGFGKQKKTVGVGEEGVEEEGEDILKGKSADDREKILRDLAMNLKPFPVAKTPSEKALIEKVRRDLGLPPEPKNSTERAKHKKAYKDQIMIPLEGKTYKEKEKNLKRLLAAGIPLPEGRTPSEKKLISSLLAAGPSLAAVPSEKLRKAKEEGLLTPLDGKPPEQQEKMLRGLAKQGIPLPKGKTPSQNNLINKIRNELGLPPEPKSSAERAKLRKAYADGLVTPLEGKTPQKKEEILRKMAEAGISLPEGRTPSEKALIDKVKAPKAKKLSGIPSEKLKKAKAEGFTTPLEGKTPEQKEKILRGLAKHGIPLPDGKTSSEKKLIDKVRKEMGLPPEPKNSVEKKKIKEAYAEGIITPLEGKTPEQKENALQKMVAAGIPLPEGRTPSEKALINKVRAGKTVKKKPSGVPSVKFKKAVAEGLITPLEGKTPEQKEKILRGLAVNGIPLPEGKSPSEKALIDKVRKDMAIPPEPKNSAEREKFKQAYADGVITPLEGKTPEQKEKALRKMAEAGIPLPKGRTPSEKALIDKVKATTEKKPSGIPPGIPSEKFRKAKAEGFITPLKGKTPEQKEKILRGLAKHGIPLPEEKSPSEKKLIDKIRKDLGLPPEPKTSTEKKKLRQAYVDGVITPLEGKTPEQKEKALRRMAEAGIPLPEGRTPSEKALIEKVKAEKPVISAEKLEKAKAAGILTPIEGKPPEEKERILRAMTKAGIPLPEGTTPEDKALIAKIKAEAAEAGPRKPSGVPTEKFKKAKAEGFITPLQGKPPEQKEKILKGLAKHGVPLPEAKSPSEKAMIDKVRKDMGLPPEPKNSAERKKFKQAYADGVITPLEGKTPEQKEKALRRMVEAGIPLPEGRTPSEKAMIDKAKATTEKKPSGIPPGIPSEKIRKAKAEGFITPLKGKTPEQKEKILKGLAKHGIPLPEGKSPSEKALIDKVRKDMGLPPEPKNSTERKKVKQAYVDGVITPLEGKTPDQKQKALRRMVEAGIPLPEGRTPSEKAMIDKAKATTEKKPSGLPPGIPSEKIRKAKAEGFITPLKGKTPEQKEKILKGLAKHGIPLPEGKSPSEKKLTDKIRQDLGLPPEPKTSTEKKKLEQAYIDGIVTPLEGKTPKQKEAALRKMAEAGVPLPEGRTPSEKALIANVKKTVSKRPSGIPSGIPSEKIRKAQAEGFVTPLAGKTPEQKEKILKGLTKHGIPLPEAKTPSEKALIDKVRKEVGLPPEPKTSAERKKIKQAYADGVITPLEGKTPEQKEKALRRMAEVGIPLPEGRTPSEKALIDKVKSTAVRKPTKIPSGIPSEKIKKAKAEGFITPLAGKTPEQKERILKGLAKNGIPLPEGKTPSEKAVIDKVRKELGLPPEPKDTADKAKMKHAYAQGLITPLEGKSPSQKENVLRKMKEAGIPLPEGRTPSEEAMINKIRAERPKEAPSGKLRKAKEAGLLTPLEGKTPEQKEKIIKGLAELGLPLPEGKSPSEKAVIDKVRKDMGLPPEPRTPSEKVKLAKLYAKGLITPLEGKTPEKKEAVLKRLAEAGIQLPEGRTPSEKALIEKVKAEKPVISAEKLEKAKAAGILTPIEEKPPEEKERILRAMTKAGIPLPEGTTPEDKALIAKIKAEAAEAGPRKPSGVPTEKFKKAKAEGFITPLQGKPPEQKEKILKGLAKHGVPLPEAKSPSEKALIDKVRKDMGLPPEPKNSAERKKIKQAYADGVITPLEGKTPEQKEKAIQRMVEAGVPLPEGRTPSEKAMIDKVKATTEKKPSGIPPGIPSEKIRKAKAEGFITPLKGKTPEQKEKILKGLAKHGIPLPEGKSPSEKKLIDKMRQDLGLPPEPKTSAEKRKLKQAYIDGIVTPLEGKAPEQKEAALRKMAEAGVPLPEGRTPSEKALIANVKKAVRKRPSGIPSGIPSEKIRKAQAEGFVTPLAGKTPEQKEKILKGLAKNGIPLPEGKTPSEKALIDKVRKEVGLPPEPTSSAEKKKIKQAFAGGIITPLEGKTPEQKEKALRRMAEAGIPLPEGRTPSEKALIDKVKQTAVRKPSSIPSGIPSEKIKKAKAEGFITPLAGKTPEQKEKILKGLTKHGIPLPEAKTPSEKALIDKVRKEVGLPPEPKSSAERKKIKQAYADGVITPLEGKTPEQKEKALQRMAEAGIPLPEGRTPSEKALIEKVKAETPVISAEKLEKAKAAGILTPIEGKPPEEKERILRAMTKAGIPLPEGKTPEDKALIAKIKAEAAEAGPRKPSGVPTEKFKKAKAEGFITPLQGKSPEQKEKILKGLAKHGVPFPEAKSPSDKALIDKVRKDMGLPPEPKNSAERKKIQQAYADGVITPLEGKTPEQKEKALQKMIEAGIPLPEGRTPSEKALINNLKATVVRKPTGVTSEKFAKAKAAGLITPLEGKSPEEKKKILQGLATNGIPFPEGKRPSEKKIMDEVRKEMGLPPLPKSPSEKALMDRAYANGIITPLEGKTPEEKEKALTRMVEAGITLPEGRTDSEKALIGKVKAKAPRPSVVKRQLKERGISAKPLGIEAQELEEITKTTKCDRACGCDRKKIRFKHSYVKIRVTSPDISSFCDCPEECIPGVKGGVFVDNEGIKVTIGFSSVPSGFQSKDGSTPNVDTLDSYPNQKFLSFCSAALGSDASLMKTPLDYSQKHDKKNKSSYLSKEGILKSDEIKDVDNGQINVLNLRDENEDNIFTDYSSIYMISSQVSNNTNFTEKSKLTQCSYDSIVLLGTESSLSLSDNSLVTELATISVISFDRSTMSISSNENSIVKSEFGLHLADSRIKNIISNSNYSTESIRPYFDDIESCYYKNDEVTILRFTRTKKSKGKDKKKEKKVIINEPDSENIMKIVAEEILNETHKSDSSSVFVVVQSEDDTNTDVSSNPSESTKKSNPKYKLRESYPIVASEHQLLVASRGVKLISTPRDMQELIPVKQKKIKNRRSTNQHNFLRAISKSENEIDFEETEIKSNEIANKKKFKTSYEINENTKNKIQNRPQFEGTQVCTYHRNKKSQREEKQKGTIILLEPKQQFFGFDLNVQSGASQSSNFKPRYLKLSKPNIVHQVIETTKSLTSMCQKATGINIKNQQKSTEIVPEYKPKGLDTSCDRPCSCLCEEKSEVGSISSPALSEMYNKGLTELSADAFIRNSIPYLYQARQYVSPYAEPSDAEPCKCCTKFDQTNKTQHSAKNEYSKPTSELWIDYGAEQHQNVVSKYASPSDLLPCACCTKNKQPDDQQYYRTERIASSPNAERQSVNSKYSEQIQNLKLIQQSLHNKFKNRPENLRPTGVPQLNNQYPSPRKDLRQPPANSYEAEYAKQATAYPEYLQTNSQYMTPSIVYQAPDDTINTAANHIRTCPKCSKNYNVQSSTDRRQPGKSLPYTDFLGQCPEFNNILKNQFLPTMDLLPNNATNFTYANYTSKGPEFSNTNERFTTPTNNFNRPHDTNNVAYSNYNGQCPENLISFQRKFVRRQNCEQDKNNNLAKLEDGSYLYGELQTVHLSQAIIYGRAQETPLEPPPTRRNTKDESCRNDTRPCKDIGKANENINSSKSNKCKNVNKADKSPDPEMCNECCVRGKIIDCVTPGRTCDPCERHGQVLPQGFKLSNTCHSKLHLRDLLVYEDSSHKCCCITNDDSASITQEGVADFCKDYCSGETVEEIRDAVQRFMRARERGLVCNSKIFNNQNICDETRELCLGIEQIVAEREGTISERVAAERARMIADENCKCPQETAVVKNKDSKVTCGNEENCKCPSPPVQKPQNQQIAKITKKPETKVVPLVDIHHVGLRELSRRRQSEGPKPIDPNLCECRFPKGKTPLEECVCPQDINCECPDLTEDQWFEYFTKGTKMTRRRDAIKLQTEMTHTTSGFKFMKNRKFCNEINTYDEAIDYYNAHRGLACDGHIKPNPDGTCPGCGDLNCPGLWVQNYFDSNNFDPEKLVQENLARHAKEPDQECMFPKCKDNTCPGMGPYGLLPPIPGGAVADVRVTGKAEKEGVHRACSCEPRDEFERDVYCPPEGPVYCECAKGSNVSCECPGGPGEGNEGDETKVKFDDTDNTKTKGWDKGLCGPLGGFKVCLPGKGTASTGLQGICCFNAFESYSKTSLKSASSDSSTYVVYV